MKRFILKLSLFLLPFVTWLGLPIAVLVRGGELTPVDTVIARQATHDETILFGPAYTNPDKIYKYRATRHRDPLLLALGSSRVMQLRADFFRRPEDFFNAGGAVSHVRHFRRFLEALPESSRLQLVVIGLDAWLFNPNYPNDDGGAHLYAHEESALNTIQRKWRAIYDDVFSSKKLRLSALASPTGAVGINAIVHGNGFRNDGSYRYGTRLDQPDSLDFWDPGFADTRERMRTGTRTMEPSADILPAALDEIRELLVYCRRRHIAVIALIPPYAPSIARDLRASPRWSYMTKLTAALRPIFDKEGGTLGDFTDVSALGTADDEFIDGLHGSEKTYARIMISISEASPVLMKWVDADALRSRLAGGATRFEIARRP